MAKVCDHTSVGMLVWRDGKLLLIERKKFPFGFAPPAGHVDGDESFETAACRELKEEVGLGVVTMKVLFEGRKDNMCRREDGAWHYWKIYEVKALGSVKNSKEETKKYCWADKRKLEKLARKTEEYLKGGISEKNWQKSPGLEPVWHEILKDLGIF